MRRRLLIVAAIVLVSTVLVGAHLYLASRLISDARLAPGVATFLHWSVVALAASLVLQPIGERTLDRRLGRFVAWPASLWMGFGFLLLVATGFSDLVLWASSAVAQAAPDAAVRDGDDAVAIARVRAGLVVLSALVVGVVAVRGGLAAPVHRRLEIVLPRWPRRLDGFRIVQISDIHIGSLLGRRFARSIVDRVNALSPDLVAITGDLVDGSVAKLEQEVAPFADLRGRLGVFFVTGNHDHYSGGRAWAEHAATLGMRVLRNERVSLNGARSGEPAGCDGSFELAGVDDHHAGYLPGEHGEDLDQALRGAPPDRALILLAHDPSTFKRACGMNVDLQLSGHTHGGQLWPFYYLVRLALPFVAGLYRRGDAQLYVSRGTGFWGPPMRLFAPAEIGEIILRSAQASPGSHVG